MPYEYFGNILILQGISSKQVNKIEEGIILLKQASVLYRVFKQSDKADKIDEIINSLKN
ncbi:hypothetical protein NIES4073_54030 [Kalymmatonema gypsitolerans NIES-4073]|nr:hypothetical protein NIES4073_54030 [Scytonema sp. NIES-4073]